MGKGKPLFEILQQQKAEHGGRLNLNAPTNGEASKTTDPIQRDETQAPGPVPTGDGLTSRAPHPEVSEAPSPTPTRSAASKKTDQPEAPAAASVDEDDGASFDVGRAARWLREPLAWRISRGVAGAAAAGLVLLMGGSFLAGQWFGEQKVVVQDQEYHAAAGSIAELQQQPTAGLIPSTVTGIDPNQPDFSMGDGDDGDDPRIGGLNYFRLIAVPDSAGEEIYRIVDFLEAHEVDAAVVPVNNGRTLKVVALPGFEKPRSDPRARQLQERLKMLGRKWRTEHDGSTDWNDLMAEKYRPGIN